MKRAKTNYPKKNLKLSAKNGWIFSLESSVFILDYSRVEVATDARHRPMKFITNDRKECGDLTLSSRA